MLFVIRNIESSFDYVRVLVPHALCTMLFALYAMLYAPCALPLTDNL